MPERQTKESKKSLAKLIVIKNLLQDEYYLKEQIGKSDVWQEQVGYHNTIKVLRRWRKEINEI